MSNGFEFVRSQAVDALNLSVEEYVHSSGARHFHLANDYDENVFMVALRTVPEDSKGVAHILEHTALCGSEKFPVRDPFFSMIRRSLNTFMNAFTTSDYTAYPFASQNRKDYFNLMEVYLDAVFFSRLNPLDFAQEGHRLEFEDPADTSSPLVYKGVVYNEMKGDSSSPVSRLYHGIQEKLYPTSTYHYNSGGDPAHIPDLSYEELQEFYRTHYHPANAVIMTFGSISAEEQQQQMAAFALDRLESDETPEISVRTEQRYHAPVNSEFQYAVDDEDLSGKTHIVLAWLLGKNSDLKMLLKGHLLSDVLLDTSASPLRLALEKSPLATGVSPMCGFEEDHMEMNFMCGVEGSEPEHADDIEKLILETLQGVAEQGVPVDRLEAVLHQLELSQREIGGDGMPYGLQLIFSCMSAAIHRADPIALLNIDSALEELREEVQQPGFIGQLVQELLLDNPHRVRVVMAPSRSYAAELLSAEKDRLDQIRKGLSETQVQDILDLTKSLAERQAAPENLDALPRVSVEDVPAAKRYPEVNLMRHKGLHIGKCVAGTNGLSYHQVVSPLPSLTIEQLGLLPLYSQLVTELGSAGRGYLETQHLQHCHTGGISSFSSIRSKRDDLEEFLGFTTLSSRTLNAKSRQMVELVRDTALSPGFDEHERIRELVQQLAMRRMNGIASNGHQYAMASAAAALRPVARINDHLTGVESILRLNRLSAQLNEETFASEFSARLHELQVQLRSRNPNLLVISDAGHLNELSDYVAGLWSASETVGSDLTEEPAASNTDRAFCVTTQVSYCASAFATVPEAHEDSAALTVLSGVLRNHFLHSAIREKGGAYGSGAGHDSVNGVFRFYSYRDPRLTETFDDFLASVDWLIGAEITDDMLDEAILGVISSVDSPGSPSGEVRQAFHHQLFGRAPQHRQSMRSRYLAVRGADLKRVAAQYLTAVPSRAVVTNEQQLAEIDGQFEITRVMTGREPT